MDIWLEEILNAQIAELNESKNSYICNSPQAFVRDRIKDSNLQNLYWWWVCLNYPLTGEYEIFNNLKIIENEKLLTNKNTFKMPEWGYKGT